MENIFWRIRNERNPIKGCIYNQGTGKKRYRKDENGDIEMSFEKLKKERVLSKKVTGQSEKASFRVA